jgi:three-Cys-motif partner protein
MSGKIGVLWPIEPHTQAKHEILRYYLGAWFPILATTQRRLVYVDGFAGPGEYEGREDGSPIIALKVARDHVLKDKLQRSGMNLVFFFIEKDEARFQNLERVLSKLQLPANFKIITNCWTDGKTKTEHKRRTHGKDAGVCSGTLAR